MIGWSIPAAEMKAMSLYFPTSRRSQSTGKWPWCHNMKHHRLQMNFQKWKKLKMDEKSENFHQKSKIFGKSKNRFFDVLDIFFRRILQIFDVLWCFTWSWIARDQHFATPLKDKLIKLTPIAPTHCSLSLAIRGGKTFLVYGWARKVLPDSQPGASKFFEISIEIPS